ncbi:MAG: peptide deformylase [Saprospirales bacterium]|nr:MAG: peptide deformylase [Saprospirales bacterium]
MILPVYGLGQAVLRKEAERISPDYPDLKELIESMWDTMYNAKGVGLAAPQIGRSIRLFLVDTEQTYAEDEMSKGICQVFINAEVLETDGAPWSYEEGCLSIPEVRAKVDRPESVLIRFQDENFQEKTERYDGINARVILHEYDHIEGVLFTDLISPLKRRMLKRKLNKIKSGSLRPDYPMKFFQPK